MDANVSSNDLPCKSSVTKRKQISLQEKLQIISCIDKGQKQTDVAERLGLSKQTVNSIIKKRKDILAKQVTGDLQPKRFRLRDASFPEVEDALLVWLRDARSRNIPVNGFLLRKRAEQLSVILGQDDFKCSEGWLNRFKSRHGISFKCMSGESASVDDSVVDWKTQSLPEILEGYEPRDVFNADESGLFYKMRPGKTYGFSGDPCHGGKRSKERVSVLFCCNMDGTEKSKLLLIGKSKRPLCLRGVYVPVEWESNGSAWMTKVIFNKWLLNFDSQMAKQKRKVLLFLDNCSSHMQIPVLQATKVAYFPPGTTSKAQPIDQGIVHSVKSRYRTRLTERLLYDMQQKRESVIDLRFAVQVLSAVWEQIEAKVIKNCFRKAGFVLGDGEDLDCVVADSDGPDPRMWAAAEEAFGQQDFAAYVDADSELVSTEEITDEEILAQVANVPVDHELDEDEEGDEDVAPRKVTTAEALEHIQGLKAYFEQNMAPDAVRRLVVMESDIVSKAVTRATQSKLTSFFSKA